MSGGGFRATKDADMSFTYLKHLNDGTTPDSVLRSFADAMSRIKHRAHQLAETNGSSLDWTDSDDRDISSNHYGYPGFDSFIQGRVINVPDVDLKTKWKHVVNGRGWEGIRLFNLIFDNVEARKDLITTHLETPMLGLIQQDGKVVGVKKDMAKIALMQPVCTKEGEKIALSRRVEKHWRLIGWGEIKRGSKAAMIDGGLK